jgi:thymidylate synthase (FAD)
MKVEIKACTPDPLRVISEAAGTCYGKDNYSENRVRNCLKSGHTSVFEHASVTFKVSGISRACSHQLVRHRLASYSQESQRYCKIDTESDEWYVIPPWFDDDCEEEYIPSNKGAFMYVMEQCAIDYQEALSRGCKPEDARYLLPEATKTTIVVTMNARELFHFLDVRNTQQAQWEIRDLAKAMIDALRAVDGWRDLVAIREEGRGWASS